MKAPAPTPAAPAESANVVRGCPPPPRTRASGTVRETGGERATGAIKTARGARLTGHELLRSYGLELVPVNCPKHFREDTPTAVLVRQVLGAIAQFEKAQLVIKLKVARD